MKKQDKKLQRELFRIEVFSRDGLKCRICGRPKGVIKLDAHHITDRHEMPNGGYVKENGISLCEQHHVDAEVFHMFQGKKWHLDMHPNDLYKLINSSYEEAVKASEKLK